MVTNQQEMHQFKLLEILQTSCLVDQQMHKLQLILSNHCHQIMEVIISFWHSKLLMVIISFSLVYLFIKGLSVLSHRHKHHQFIPTLITHT